MIGNVGAVFLFEWKRSLTAPRMAWWLVLAGFPIFIFLLIRLILKITNDDAWLPREFWIWFLFALIPMLISMLGTMLWMTPAISAELERRSWVYLAVRPNGGAAVLIGKYLAAVTWVVPPALLGLTGAIMIIAPTMKEPEPEPEAVVVVVAKPLPRAIRGKQAEVKTPRPPKSPFQIWWAMAKMVCLSTPAFAAVYLLLGTIMPRRGMVLAVGYSLLFELVISFVPAVINNLTIHHHLQALVIEWCAVELPPSIREGAAAFLGNSPLWYHVAFLMAYPVVLLAVSVAMLRAKEFSSSAEAEV